MGQRGERAPAPWNGADLFVCPTCRSALAPDGVALRCTEGHAFALVGPVPVLFPDGSSFDADQTAQQTGGYFEDRVADSQTKASWRRRLPSPGYNRRAAAFEAAADDAIVALVAEDPVQRGLIIGAGERGRAQAEAIPQVDWLLTDVDLSYGADAAVDSTCLPLADATVDVILISHVLEHVIDPVAGAGEIERVLRPGGLVIATIPFSFPWHGVPFDFFRVTPSGMRALFRGCDVVYLAPGMGNGSAMGHGTANALTIRRGHRIVRWASYAAARILAAPLKHLDRIETDDMATSGFAAEIQFVGRRATVTLTDREVLDDVRKRFT